MRGADEPQTTLFSYVSVKDRIPADHPLRTIHALVNPILAALSPKFAALYSRWLARRFRRNGSCARCCSRCCTPCAANAS